MNETNSMISSTCDFASATVSSNLVIASRRLRYLIDYPHSGSKYLQNSVAFGFFLYSTDSIYIGAYLIRWRASARRFIISISIMFSVYIFIHRGS
jgi:hypothetical protein